MKKILLMTLALAVWSTTQASTDTLWTSIYNPSTDSASNGYGCTDDNTYLYVCGDAFKNNYDAVLLKYDKNSGDTIWSRYYNSEYNKEERYTDVILDTNSLFAVGRVNNATNSGILISKYNINGDTIWNKRIWREASVNYFVNQCYLDNSGNLFLVGESEKATTDYIFIAKLNKLTGDTIWIKEYDTFGRYDHFVSDIDSSGLYVAYTDNLYKINLVSGDTIWAQHTTNVTGITAIACKWSDSTLITVGYPFSDNRNIVIYNANNGDTISTHTFSDTNAYYYNAIKAGSSLYLFGICLTNSDGVITKIDQYFNKVLNYKFLYPQSDVVHFLDAKEDNSNIFYITGNTRLTVPSSLYSALMVKLRIGLREPYLLTPLQYSSFTTSTVNFTWHPVDSATSYRLQISPFSNFSSLTYNQTSSDTFQTSTALPNDWYYWRVKAYDATDSSDWSEVRSFSVATSTVGIPALTFPPADTTTNDSFPNFDWSDMAGATQYELQVGKGHRWAYVANASSGLEIYNISDTANVYQISPYSGSGIWCNKMTLQDTLMPIACYSSVKLYNVADPRNPVLRSNISVNNLCAVVRGTYMYVGDQNYGLWVYDISNPASPAVAARFDTTNRVRDLAISGNVIYLIGDAALKSVNITDPLNPALIGSLAVSGDDMVLSGNYCYLTNGSSLTVVDVSTPASPVQVGFMNTGPGSYQQLAVKGNFAYIGAGYEGVRVVNISNPAGPFQAALYDTTGYDFSLVAVSGDYLVTGGEYSGSFLLNISDPYHPRAVNHMAGGSRIYAVAMADSFAANEYDTALAASSCQIDTFLGDASHYWRVRAGAGSWGDYSSARRFTLDTQPPAKTSHVLPNPGQLINTPKPAFDYSDISDAYRYQLQVCRDSSFAVLEKDTLVSAGGCTLLTALGDGRHWWHVRARDLAGNWAPWSDSTYFRLDTQAPGAPAAITANGANPSLWTKNNSFNVSFTAPFDSSGLQYYYYKYGSAPSSNYDTTGQGYHSTTLPIPVSVQNIGITPFYVWARDNAGNLDYRNHATVNLRYDTIPPTGAIARSNEFSRTANFTVSWNDGTDQGGSGLKDYYYIKIKVNSGAWNDLNTYYAGNSYIHTGVQGSKYYFEVAALDSAGNTEAFAAAAECSILVDNTITSPILVSPYNGEVRPNASNIFLWQRAAAQAGSRLQCSYNQAFTALAKDTLLAADSSGTLSLTDSLYYWRVRGENSASDTSVWSPARTLRIDTQAPAVPVLALPGNDSLINDNTPQFTWGAVAGAVQYRLAVSPDSAFGSAAVDEIIDTTAYTIQVTLPDSAYYWKARAGDAAGNWSDWSSRRKFTVDTRAPAVPVPVAPLDNALLNTNLPSFIWNASAQATQYRVQAANNTSFSPLEMDSALADTAVRPLWGLNDGTHYWRVRCRDQAGNWSAYSTYRTVTIAGLLQVALITPDTGALWAPSQSVWIQFSKPIYTGIISSGSIDTSYIKIRGRHTPIARKTFTWESATNTLRVAPDTSFAANDTITVFISGALRDYQNTPSSTLDGNNDGTAAGAADSFQMTFRTSFIGDYNADGLLNGPDLALFAWGWHNYSRYFEAGPYFGTWPHQRIYAGSSTKLDFEDLMGLIYSWNRSGSAKSSPAKSGDSGPVTMEVSPGDAGQMLVKVKPGTEFSALDVSIEYGPAAGTGKVAASELWNSEGNPQLFLTRQTPGRTEISAALWPGGSQTTDELFRFSLSETKGETPVSLSYRLYDRSGEVTAEGSLSTALEILPGLPAVFSFSPARPNPAGHSTVISYQLPAEADVRLEIYNIAGQKVATLAQGRQPAGYHSRTWDLKDSGGRRVANGVYLFKLQARLSQGSGGQAGEFSGMGKMVVIR